MTYRTGVKWMAALGIAAGAGAAAAAAIRAARRIDLRDRVVIVTGGSRGLGHTIAEEFLHRGAKLAICSRHRDELTRAEEDFRRRGGDVLGVTCDLMERTQAEAFIAKVLDHFGRIDILVNNAGQCFVGPAVELTPEDLDHALRGIFWCQYYPTMAVLPHMRSRRFGRIVNVTSIGGKVPTPHMAAYNTAKYASTGWSETLAVELAKEGIRVSTVTPPTLKDGALMPVHFNGRAEEELLWFGRSLTSPLRATDPRRAARAVVEAAEYGDPQTAVSPLSWMMQRAHGLAPNLMTPLLSLVDRFYLPDPGPPGRTSRMVLGSEIAARDPDRRIQSAASRAIDDAAKYRPAAV
ncbi:MAG: SDR family oxidoreductase [Isosphaeraceae bacterium]